MGPWCFGSSGASGCSSAGCCEGVEDYTGVGAPNGWAGVLNTGIPSKLICPGPGVRERLPAPSPFSAVFSSLPVLFKLPIVSLFCATLNTPLKISSTCQVRGPFQTGNGVCSWPSSRAERRAMRCVWNDGGSELSGLAASVDSAVVCSHASSSKHIMHGELVGVLALS